MTNKKWILGLLIILLLTLIGVIVIVTLNSNKLNSAINSLSQVFPQSKSLKNPFVSQSQNKKEFPLLKYSIPNLKKYPYQASSINVIEQLSQTEIATKYLFTYQTTDKTISGTINIPRTNPGLPLPVIILIRGWVPKDIYQSGVGTRHAAEFFAKNGYITFAPDFLGYGQSDANFKNSWKSRFVKPINILELIKSIKNYNKLEVKVNNQNKQIEINKASIGIWAHSNGGQIALTSLEASSENYPTTLWAPVTVPFPYSILFFSDEHEDEGKAMRNWLAQFERDYDVFDFSLSQHLDQLTAPLQLHHGTADEAALKIWSDEFVDKIELENEKRKEIKEKEATLSATVTIAQNNKSSVAESSGPLSPIKLNYYVYPGADHNLQPNQNWEQAIKRDLKFFNSYLKTEK